MKIKTLIADDEYSGRCTLELLLKALIPDNISLQIHLASTLEETSNLLNEHYFDIIFLDINFKGVSSFQILQLVPQETKIIFVTAYSEHAIQAIRNNAFDYLLKPVKEQELADCLDRFYQMHPTKIAFKQIQIKDKGYTRWLKTSAISHVRGQGPYSVIFYDNEQITVAKTLKSLSLDLNENFVRIHKSFLVNRKFVKAFQRDQLILNNQICLPISRNGVKNLDAS